MRLREQPRKPRDTFQRPARKQQICTAPQRERFDARDIRRGFSGLFANSHGPAATALRPRRRGSRAQIKHRKKSQVFLTSTTPISAEARAQIEDRKLSSVFYIDHADLRRGSRGHRRNHKKVLSFLAPTTPIFAEGRAHRSEIAKSPQLFNVDHTDPRKGLPRRPKKRRKEFETPLMRTLMSMAPRQWLSRALLLASDSHEHSSSPVTLTSVAPHQWLSRALRLAMTLCAMTLCNGSVQMTLCNDSVQ